MIFEEAAILVIRGIGEIDAADLEGGARRRPDYRWTS